MEKPKGLPLVHVEKRDPLSSGGSDVSQCLFHCIFEQAGVGVAEISPFENRIVRANTAFAQLLGRTPQELLHKQLAELTSSLDSQISPAEQFARLWRGEIKTCSWYASYEQPSGPLCNAKVTVSAMWESGTPPTSCIMVLDDITDQKNAERQLLEHQQQLEHRVQARTVELESALESLRFQMQSRKRIEEELRQSVTLYRTIAATIPDAAVFVVDQDLRFRVAEGRLLPRLGISRNQLEGAVVGQPSQGAAGQLLHEIFAKAMAGHTASCEKPHGQRTLYFLYTPVCNQEYAIVGAVVLALDVSERKRVEGERRSLEQQYLRIVETANEGIWVVDHNFTTTFVNDRMAIILGCSREEMIGSSKANWIFPEDLPEYEHRKQLRNDGNDQRYEARFRRKDGTACWLQVSAKAVLDEAGHQIESFGMFTDITQRRMAEEQLRQSEEQFRSLIEASTEGILVFSAATQRIRYANPRVCEMLCLSTQELIGQSFSELFTPGQKDSGLPTSNRSDQNLWPNTGELRRKDGNPVRVDMNSVVLDLNGERCHALFLTDLTKRSMLEQEQLKAQKLDAIGTLAGGIAHDFNNLLQAIYANISMARWSYDDRSEAMRRLESVEHSLHMAIKLTGQLLAFSKGGTLKKRRVALGPLIEEATGFILSGAKTICQLDIAPDLAIVLADEGQLNQVIYNVVLNADQAMPFGGKIQLVARNVKAPAEDLPIMLEPGCWVEVIVKDSGVGIAEEHMSRIFDPYFSTKATGNGLGLATTYAIVRKHGGYIDVKSKLGEGTCVAIYLPATDGAAERTDTRLHQEVAQPLRVLLLDDDQTVRETSEALLQVLGHTVVSVPHGEAALAAYESAAKDGVPFDLVLLDLTIRGGMGGMETLHHLREIDPKVCAILTSGYSDDSISLSALPRQARLFLPKPYTLEQLRDAIRVTIEESVQAQNEA